MPIQDNLLFQYYLVVFFDHLGQREQLRKITGIPTTEAEKKKFIETTKESVGRVLHIRDSFKHYFDSASSYIPDVTPVPPEHRDEFLASRNKPAVSYYGLSDAMIIAVPLMSVDENCTAINGICDAIVATCGIGLLSLSVHIPMRAGLDVGVATQIDDKEIYGPALESAFYLESKLAEYPRFLVGKELINYLLWVEHQTPQTRIGLVAKESARFCREMIIQDNDGRYMLDFLGSKIKEASDGVLDQKLVAEAFEFVNSQYTKYLKEENETLQSRYYRLLRYFHSRKKIWGLS
jgi:hypothetical protein